MMCETCEERPADRSITIWKESGSAFLLRVCSLCAVWFVEPVGIDQLPPSVRMNPRKVP